MGLTGDKVYLRDLNWDRNLGGLWEEPGPMGGARTCGRSYHSAVLVRALQEEPEVHSRAPGLSQSLPELPLPPGQCVHVVLTVAACTGFRSSLLPPLEAFWWWNTQLDLFYG